MKKTRPRAACVLGLLALAWGCAGLDERERALLAEARSAGERHDWRRSVEALNRLLETRPDMGKAYLERGRAQYELANFEFAAADFERAKEAQSLEPEEEALVTLNQGRLLIVQGEEIYSQSATRQPDAAAELQQRARQTFQRANDILLRGVEEHPGQLDLLLWRGYALLRMENYPKAVAVFEACREIDPRRWEHRYFAGLACEGQYGLNAQSLGRYRELVAGPPRQELLAVYEHLAEIAPRIEGEDTRWIFDALSAYANTFERTPRSIEAYLTQVRRGQSDSQKLAQLTAASREIERLLQDGDVEGATKAIDSCIGVVGASVTLSAQLAEAQERWSLLLEAISEKLLTAGDRKSLEQTLTCLQAAHRLTAKVSRLVVLQQKINALNLSLDREASVARLDAIEELVQKGKHEDALTVLASMPFKDFSEKDQDRHRFLTGIANYHLGRWGLAVRSLEAVRNRSFEHFEVFLGLSLVRSGNVEKGLSIFEGLAPELVPPTVRLEVATLFLEKHRPETALARLLTVRPETPELLRAIAEARLQLAEAEAERRRWAPALDQVSAVCEAAEQLEPAQEARAFALLGLVRQQLGQSALALEAYSKVDLSAAEKTPTATVLAVLLGRSRIYLAKGQATEAYEELTRFVRSGGEVPADLEDDYGRLVSAHADYMPVEHTLQWNYSSVTADYDYQLLVKGSKGGAFIVERREPGLALEESWEKDGDVLIKRIGGSTIKIPIRVGDEKGALPQVRVVADGQDCLAEVAGTRQTIEVRGRRYTNCLKIRVRRTDHLPDGAVRTTKSIIYLAPEVGEVRQETFRDDSKVSEIVLVTHTLRAE